MARETTRCKEKHVHTLIITGPDEARSDSLRRRHDPPKTPCIYRQIEVRRTCPPLHFHEGYRSTTAGDKIDFATRGLHSLGEYAPPLAPQIPCGQRFSAPAKAFPLGAAHFSSIARA